MCLATMRTFVLLSLAALALGATARAPAGIQERVSGGGDPKSGEGKYAVEVVQDLSWIPWTDSHLCTGALVDKEWVLTTVTCLKKPLSLWYRRRYFVGRSSSSAGTPVLEEKIIKHEAYDQNTGKNNIALVKLEKKVEPTAAAGVVNLPTQNDKAKGNGLLAGFGASRKLQVVKLKILDKEECAAKGVDADKLCTEPGKGACEGDEGSPLAVPLGSSDSKLLGLATGSMPCTSNDMVGSYVDVARYSEWVVTTILAG